MLDHHKAGITVVVQHERVMHILIRDGTLEPQEAVSRVLEGTILVGGHHSDEHVDPDLGAKVNDVTLKVGSIDLGGVNLNDGKILGALPHVKTKLNGRGVNNMAQHTHVWASPACWDVPVEDVESPHCPLSLGQLIPSLFALLFSCIDFDFGDTLLQVRDHERLMINLILNGLEELLKCCISEENYLTAGRTGLVFKRLIVISVQLKDNMPRCDEEEPLTAATFGNKKAACTLSARCELASDGEPECGSEMVANVYSWVKGEGGHEELGAFQKSHKGLADLDIDIDNAKLWKNLLATAGHFSAILDRERFGLHADPEDNGTERLFLQVADANYVNDGPNHLLRIQVFDDLGRQVALPDILDGMPTDGPKHLVPGLCLGAPGLLPQSGAAANQGGTRGKASIIELGLPEQRGPVRSSAL